jgi:SAM-dependent methyltransferase
MKLTTEKYWEGVWTGAALPSIIRHERNYALSRIHKILQRYVAKGTFLEVGCAPGSWMAYFSRRFGCKVYGIEYSQVGYLATLQNLKILGVPAKVEKADFFRIKTSEKYSTVFSYGFVEHFDDKESIEAIRKKISLTAPNGKVITIVPNLHGFNGLLQKSFDRAAFKAHNPRVMTLEWLRDCHKNLGLDIEYAGYIGVYNPFIIKSNSASYRSIAKTIAGMMAKAAAIIPKIETRFLSPYIMIIGRKSSS